MDRRCHWCLVGMEWAGSTILDLVGYQLIYSTVRKQQGSKHQRW